MNSIWLEEPGNVGYPVTIEVRRCDERVAYLFDIVKVRTWGACCSGGWERPQISRASRRDGKNERKRKWTAGP